MDLILLPFALVAAVASYWLGLATTKHPGEDEMFARLVQLRANRKIESRTKEALESEVESAAERMAGPRL
jgi:hypothetical protein